MTRKVGTGPTHDRGRPGEKAPSNGVSDDNHIVAAPADVTTRLRGALDDLATRLDDIAPVIEQSKSKAVYGALGYDTWTAYVCGEFGDQLTRLASHNRGPVIELLSGPGMSTRGIEAAAGIPKSVVGRHLSHIGTPDRPVITGPTISGNDGKTYTRPEPKPPRRRPLSDSYRDTSWKVLKGVESLSRLHQDDRFTANRESVKRHARDLARAANELCDLLDDLGIDRHQYGGAR